MSGRRVRTTVLSLVGLTSLFLALTFSFVSNGFGVAPWNEWAAWEKGSEAMVLQRIEFDLLDRESSPFGLGPFTGTDVGVYERLSRDELQPEEAPETFDAYTSEVGGQAYFWSFMWREVGCSSVSCLHLVNSMLFAGAVIAMFVGFGLLGSWWLGAAWLLSAALSPWFVFAARNLFWSPWLYFLPVIAAFGVALAKGRRTLFFSYAVLFASFFIKFVASGYHEFTAVLMLAGALPLVGIFFEKFSRQQIRTQVRRAIGISVVGAFALGFVITIHAFLLTGSVGSGLTQLWSETVVRRTVGSTASSNPVLVEAAAATPFDVLERYVWSQWWTDLLKFSFDASGSLVSFALGPRSFVVLSVVSVAVVLLRFRSRDARWKRDLALLAVGFSVAAVWLVAAKSYAYIHWFILFFLWYFMYVPAMIYVIGAYVGDRASSLRLKSRQTLPTSQYENARQ